MLNIVFGLIAICLGIWGLTNYWWYVVDFLAAILPLALIFGGFIAVIAGIKNSGIQVKTKEEQQGSAPAAAGPTTTAAPAPSSNDLDEEPEV